MHRGVSPWLNSGGGRGREVRPDTFEIKVAALRVGSQSRDHTEKWGDCEKSKVISGLRIVVNLKSGNPSIS